MKQRRPQKPKVRDFSGKYKQLDSKKPEPHQVVKYSRKGKYSELASIHNHYNTDY
jgi:hypothetical protein